jgi:ATP-dependent DNA helicase RecQ
VGVLASLDAAGAPEPGGRAPKPGEAPEAGAAEASAPDPDWPELDAEPEPDDWI